KELEAKNYYQNLALAERELSVHNVGRAEEILDACPAHLRSWEWHCLKRLRYRNFPALQQYPTVAYSPVFSPDGRYLASGSRDGTIQISEVATGKELRTLKPGQSILGVAYSPDGRFLATCGLHRTVLIWNATTGDLIASLAGHDDTVGGVVFSPNGK